MMKAIGLAALYSSCLLDVYFRTVNGNTQVNATELRSIPLPPIELIVALGQRVKRFSSSTPEIDQYLQFLLEQSSLKGGCGSLIQKKLKISLYRWECHQPNPTT